MYNNVRLERVQFLLLCYNYIIQGDKSDYADINIYNHFQEIVNKSLEIASEKFRNNMLTYYKNEREMAIKYPRELIEKNREILEKAGWYPNRKVDVQIQGENANKVFETAKLFVQEFGGLEINSRDPNGVHTFPEHKIDLDALVNCEIERIFGEQVIYVGYIMDSNYCLYIAESGRVYANEYKIGDTFEQAWNDILNY